MDLERKPFGSLPDGGKVDQLTLSNSQGLRARIITYGGILSSLVLPDRRGEPGEITLGFDTLEEYLAGHPYFGCIVGRFANRIAGGRFRLDGGEYLLACNEKGINHLHGGVAGFDKKLWKAKELRGRQAGGQELVGVELSRRSPDGEEGYPGTLEVTVTYTLSESGELGLEYRATTDRPTPINLTHHGYWNLAGAGSGSVADHKLELRCPLYLPVDKNLIPTGEVHRVAGTPMDFTRAKRVGAELRRVRGGYDHCYVAEKPAGELGSVARLYEPHSGRGMEVLTTKPAVQLYTGNFLDGVEGSRGAVFNRHGALCLETEYYPDAVNHPGFPSAVLRPGETYHHRTIHRFFLE